MAKKAATTSAATREASTESAEAPVSLDANPARLNLDLPVPSNPQEFGAETLRLRDSVDPDDPGAHFRMGPLRPETLKRTIR